MRSTGPMCVSFALSWLFTTITCYPQANSAVVQPEVRVPFVGCKADGQVGPQPAPHGTSRLLHISPDAARQLSYYKGRYGEGVLAPRGWNCFQTYGSNGSNLYVSPELLNSEKVFSDKWKGFTGPVVQLSESVGDTSGRFEVAQVIARLFPDRTQFVRNVIAENIEPARDFPFGPYPADSLIKKDRNIVEYETPANTAGMGTNSRLQANADSIRGVEILTGTTPDLVSLTVRLPPEIRGLADVMIRQMELGNK